MVFFFNFSNKLIIDGPRSSFSNNQSPIGAYINNYDDYSFNSRPGFVPPSHSSLGSYVYDRGSERGSGYQGRYSSNTVSNSKPTNSSLDSGFSNFFKFMLQMIKHLVFDGSNK